MPFPIRGHCYITQEFGATSFAKSAFGKKLYKNFGGIHPGIDLGTGGINLPIVSLIDGKVVRASLDGGWGNHVEVEGKDGWRRQYGHLSFINVKVGDKVVVGQELGKVGNTGSSTATHLHYANRKSKLVGWEYRDPSIDFKEVPQQPIMPKGKLIKSTFPFEKSVFVYNGKVKFPIPDWPTKVFLFGDLGIEGVEPDILDKIPTGPLIPSLQ